MVLWTLIAFLSGSIPFSLIIGYLVAGVDIREYGDANPGATNVGRALGRGWAALAGLLDGLKGAVPVGLAFFAGGITDWRLVPVVLAPVFGHAFSPWLRFRGGKAVAASFGIWAGLTLGTVPTLFGLLLGIWYTVLTVSGWSVIAAMLCLGLFLFFYYGSPVFMAIWVGNLLVFVIKHRSDLREPIAIRDSLLERTYRLLRRTS